MSTVYRTPDSGPDTVHGATALTTLAADGEPQPHRLGDGLRALRVFAATAARVVLLGEVEEHPAHERHSGRLPRQR